MSLRRVILVVAAAPAHAQQDADQVLEHRKRSWRRGERYKSVTYVNKFIKSRHIEIICISITSDDEENGDVGLGGALVEVDRPDDDHGQRDHDRHRARDRATNRAQ